MPINLPTIKLFVFVNKLFTNNKDFSSQLGYKIIITNKFTRENDFIIHSNFIHWSLTKSKRITQSILASEIYKIVSRVNIVIAIRITLKMITDRLKLPIIPIIVCTDLYSLYKCLVKLSTIKEKCLMIDIIVFQQSYKRQKLFKI
jgi:hypothetical protein